MIFSFQVLTVALAATVAARPGDFDKGRKPGPNPPSRSTTMAKTTKVVATTTTNPPQASSAGAKFFPFPFRGPNKNNNKCWSDFKDCRRNSDSASGACVSTYAGCIGTQPPSRMPATSVTSAPGGMPSSQSRPLPPFSHIGKHHGGVRKCNQAYWACLGQSSGQQSSCFSDLSTCLANIGASVTSTGSATASATASATGTSVVAANPTATGSDDDDDDNDDDSSPSNATS
ncbi:hypothetical protein NCS52_01289200 [Fusarium sp. LHS14.1]|nr:hypothetical protein NCS52_01289200 [Fusarium sp. LHS14.1]